MPIIRVGDPTPTAISGARLILLSENLTPDDISDRIGLRPDAAWRRGEARGASGAVQKFNGWELKSEVPAPADPVTHVRGLLNRLRPYWDRLRELIRSDGTMDARLWVSHHIENWNPEFYFDPTTLREIADLGVAMSVDVYSYEPGELTDKVQH